MSQINNVAFVGSSKNWETYSRRMKVANARPNTIGRVTIKVVFESLEFYAKNPERHAGNWIVIPHDWRQLSDDVLHKFRFAHNKKKCAMTRILLESDKGDLLFRIRDEVVEMLEILSCPECSFA